jgi:hypothetical protein
MNWLDDNREISSGLPAASVFLPPMNEAPYSVLEYLGKPRRAEELE